LHGRLGYRFDRESFEPRGQFKYACEGWGLTTDGVSLIMSDGSSRLTWRDPNTFEVTRTVHITDRGLRVKRLNELEWVRDRIYANVWMTSLIAIIDPASGQVTAWIDLAGLKARHREGEVLNGIAYDPDNNRLFVTGKWWSKLYEIEVLKTRTP
jgi:glutamine cyclotransferase